MIPSLSLDINYNLKVIFTDNNQLPPVTDPKIDKIFNKNININNKDTLLIKTRLSSKSCFWKLEIQPYIKND